LILILILILFLKNQDQKIAAFGSSYTRERTALLFLSDKNAPIKPRRTAESHQ